MVFRTMLLAGFILFSNLLFAQPGSQINIFLPEFFKQETYSTTNQNWQVACFDKHGNEVSSLTENFIDLVSICECAEYSSFENDYILRYTFRRLSPVMWERADHEDHGRVQLFFDLPSNVIATDTVNYTISSDRQAMIVKHYYQLRQCY